MALPAKIAAAILTDERGRKAVGWAVAAILSPLILLVAFLCALGAGTAEHNNQMLDHLFYGTELTTEMPAEFAQQMADMQKAFSCLDSAVSSINQKIESGSLDPIQIKAAYFVLGGEIAPERFVECFYREETRTRTVTKTDSSGNSVEVEEHYTVYVPASLDSAYAAISGSISREVAQQDKDAVQDIYSHIAGSGGEGYDGSFIPGGSSSIELDISSFKDPGTKNSADLAAYAINAWQSGWGYVWGTYGNVLTGSLLNYKVSQYPDGVGKYEGFIRSHWLGRRTTDCVGLIKGYGWLDPESGEIKYGSHGMPDLGANGMCRAAKVKGPMNTMPDIPGIAVWMPGHIGVYIGNGEVIEAASTKKGVIKTKLAGRGWQKWLEVPGIQYE